MNQRVTRTTRRALAALTTLAMTASAHATPYALTAADRAEITALARSFFESARDATRDVRDVYPTVAEMRALFPTPRAAADAGVSPVDEVVQRQLRAIERDVRDLAATFHGGRFVGLGARSYPRNTVDLRPCGRFARADTQCGDGPLIEYAVGEETRRFRLDTLVRLRGRWRVYDVR